MKTVVAEKLQEKAFQSHKVFQSISDNARNIILVEKH